MGVLRVMMLSTDLEKGGLPLRLVNLARCLRSVDVEPIVGCLSRRGPLNDALESAGIETFSCDAAGRFDVRCLHRLALLIRRIDPDLIHSALFHANVAARACGRIDRCRPILTSTVTIEIERRWHRWVEALTAGRSDLHVANSEAVAEHLRAELGFQADRLQVIRNGLDPSEFDKVPPARRGDLGLEDDLPLILWAGRMDPVKNLDTFVYVLERLISMREVRALLVGDGPTRPRIEALVKSKGLERIIRFAGWSNDVAAWLKTANVLLFPSRTEGAPNVVLEAMACGCPVVVSDVPACAEMVAGSGAGEICPPHDVAGFADKIEELLADKARAACYTERGRAYVLKRHSMQHVVVAWRAAYDRLMGGP